MLPLHLLPVYRKCKILGHDSILIDDIHTRRFQVKADWRRGSILSNLARWRRPRVQTKMDATGLMDVSFPF